MDIDGVAVRVGLLVGPNTLAVSNDATDSVFIALTSTLMSDQGRCKADARRLQAG
jgi:hypothetical protein